MRIGALALTTIAVLAFASACGDSPTPPPTFRLVVRPVRDPEARSAILLDRIDGVAVVAIRPPEGPIDLRVEDRADPEFSVTNLTGEEILVSLFRDGYLVSEARLLEGDTWVLGPAESAGLHPGWPGH